MERKNFNLRNWQTAAILIFGVLISFRFLLSSRLPAYLLPDMIHDDGWVFRRAANMLKGEWLGAYDQFTLIKGAFSPLLLAFSAGSGLTFSGLNTGLYCLACVLFVVAIRPLIQNRWLQIFCFAILLFNPIVYALHTGQRVYRIGMGQWEILLIFGCLIAIFLRRNVSWGHVIKWGFVCGLALGAFLQTREDSIWIYPFVFGMIICTVISFLVDGKGERKKIIYFLLPLVVAFFVNGLLAAVNYSRYGVFMLNDRSGGNFAKVAADLHLITPNAGEDLLYASEAYKGHYYNIYISTIDKAFEVSPTLKSVEQPIRTAIRMWGGFDSLKSGQLETDHMLFALRDGVKIAGHYKSLPETEKFYGNVHKELQEAFESRKLAKRGFSISPLIKPLQKRDVLNALSLMPAALKDVINFRGVSSAAIPSIGNSIAIRQFGLLAGGDHFYMPGRLIASGWAFAKDDGAQVHAGLYDKDGVLIKLIPFLPGADVYQHMLTKGYKYQNARSPRFYFEIDGYDLNSGVTLRFLDKNKKIYSQIPVNGYMGCREDGSFVYCIDKVTSDTPEIKIYSYFVERANFVGGLYNMLIPILCIVGGLAYFAASLMLLLQILKRKALNTLPIWLVLTGIGATFISFMFSMCIITATSFNALVYWYTAPAYILLLMFIGVSIGWGLETIAGFRGLRAR